MNLCVLAYQNYHDSGNSVILDIRYQKWTSLESPSSTPGGDKDTR